MSTPLAAVGPFSDAELDAWHGMLHLHSLVLRELDRGLLLHHHVTVREFDVLITLFNAPDQRFRMSELAEQVMLSASGLTRMVERLERAGLAERQPDPTDARSSYTVLTPAGLKRLDEARVTHNAVIRELFTDHLSSEELRQVGDLWKRILAAIEPRAD